MACYPHLFTQSCHLLIPVQVEAKRAVPKEEKAPGTALPPPSPGPTVGAAGGGPPSSSASSSQQLPAGAAGAAAAGRKVFVGGLASSVDEKALREYFAQWGAIEDAVVMYDHHNRRPRGFGFITYESEGSIDRLFSSGVLHLLQDKQVRATRSPPPYGLAPSFAPMICNVWKEDEASASAPCALVVAVSMDAVSRHAIAAYAVKCRLPPSSRSKIWCSYSFTRSIPLQVEIKPAVPRDNMTAHQRPPQWGMQQGAGPRPPYGPPGPQGGYAEYPPYRCAPPVIHSASTGAAHACRY